MIPKEKTANHSLQFRTSRGSSANLLPSRNIFKGFPPPPPIFAVSRNICGNEIFRGDKGQLWGLKNPLYCSLYKSYPAGGHLVILNIPRPVTGTYLFSRRDKRRLGLLRKACKAVKPLCNRPWKDLPFTDCGQFTEKAKLAGFSSCRRLLGFCGGWVQHDGSLHCRSLGIRGGRTTSLPTALAVSSNVTTNRLAGELQRRKRRGAVDPSSSPR